MTSTQAPKSLYSASPTTMFAPSTSSQRATPSTLARLPTPRVCLPQGDVVTRVYAVKLDDECVDRWGEILYDEVYPGKRERVSPEDFRDALDRMQTLTVNYMAHRIYCEFPNIPILRRASLFVPCPRRVSWLFVFKDNSSHEALHAPLDPADVIGVKSFIGVEKQSAKWYHVNHKDD
ncbi:hypothetical protein C8Q74DRAFT_1445349 [Fomes fomentarius]|nr:hypothetical protein C8Q74DRAFT_1445349 [Fomes fomentarius]